MEPIASRPLTDDERAALLALRTIGPRGPLWWLTTAIAMPILGVLVALALLAPLLGRPGAEGALIASGIALVLGVAVQLVAGRRMHDAWCRFADRRFDGGGHAELAARALRDERAGLAERLELAPRRLWWIEDVDDDIPALLVDVGEGRGVFLFSELLLDHAEDLFDDEAPRALGTRLAVEHAPASAVILAIEVGGEPLPLEQQALRGRDLPGYDGQGILALDLAKIDRIDPELSR